MKIKILTTLTAMAILAVANPTTAQAVSAIYGGGPLYKTGASTHINELKASGFSEVVVWNISVSSGGGLNFNGEFPLCSGGSYIGGSTHSGFASEMSSLKSGISRLTFSVGAAGASTFGNIKNLVNSQGTGSGSILYKNFRALALAIPAVDAIDLDDETTYDKSSMVKFAVMLGHLGFKVSLCPYNNVDFWVGVASSVNSQRSGTIDRVHLQCYDGGAGNHPCNWHFGSGIYMFPGLSNSSSTSTVKSKMAAWHSECGVIGGFIYLYDYIEGRAASYASAVNSGL